MTDQQRMQGFLEAVRVAELTYGLSLQAEVKVERLGEAVLMRPDLVVVPLANWQPPHAKESPNGTLENPLPTPPYQPPQVMGLSANGSADQ